jgi:hypothetical protein
MVLSRVLRVAIADAGMSTVPGFPQAHALRRVAALDAFHVPGDLANDAAAPRDRQSVHAT